MKTTNSITITNEEAIVLQQICESGEEDVMSLARGLHMNRARVMRHLEHLKHKGLITIKATYGDWWVRTSSKGAQLVQYMWPEMIMSY